MRNWAGNHEYRARAIHAPASVEEVQELVRGSKRIRALGSRHSFNDVADSDGDLLSLHRLPRLITADGPAGAVTVDGGARYGDIAEPLHRAGLALHNLASLPHISVAGACATGTHGSGTRSANLSTAVQALDIVRADGELVTLGRGDSALAGSVVGLGSLGVVTRLTLAAEAAYDVRQDVFEDLPQDRFEAHFDEIAGMADSVSFFTEWRGPVIDQVWLKRRTGGALAELGRELAGAPAADRDMHPIRGLPAEACTPQLGVPGPWHERLPHFRMDHTPSSGDELQSEYFVGREDAVAAFRSLDRLRESIAPLIQVSEIRLVAEDELWLSPAYGRPSVTFHFTWKPDWPGVRALLPRIEAALAPYGPRPHWGKLFTLDAAAVRAAYPRLSEFVALAAQFDPDAKFRNDFTRRLLFDPEG
jgi:alditol oxidase